MFADQTAEPVPPQDPAIRVRNGRTLTPSGRPLAERPVRTMNVMVLDVLTQDQPQAPLAGYQHPVQALAPGAGNPPLRDRVRPRRPDRRLDDPHTSSGEHRVKGRRELGVPVPDQELQPVRAVPEAHRQVAGLLGYPLPRRVGGDPLRTRRVPCSMKNRTYRRRKSTGSSSPGHPVPEQVDPAQADPEPDLPRPR